MIREINFDGLIGPTHNYAGLSLGNLASANNAGGVSRPRSAALQGLGKMRTCLDLGLTQGLLVPPERPARRWLDSLGLNDAAASKEDPKLFGQAMSASSMWAANAATVVPASDAGDGKCHLTVANLSTMVHRSFEHWETEAQLRVAFADPSFVVHGPVPGVFGDEGAANHMRLAGRHDEAGVEIFVFGEDGGKYPARQNRRASEAVARLSGLDLERTMFVRQSSRAIEAGAFHNDVVAVANENVLFAHELAFENSRDEYEKLERIFPELVIVEVPEEVVSLSEAIQTYLFNSQLVTLADGSMCLILPEECRESAAVSGYLRGLLAGSTPIRRVEFVEVRESMRNGGGPACLRLRVVADPAKVDQRFMLDHGKIDRLSEVVSRHWPESIAPDQLGDPGLWAQARTARAALLAELGLTGAL